MFVKLMPKGYMGTVLIDADKIFSCHTDIKSGQMVITDDGGKEHTYPVDQYYIKSFFDDLQKCKDDLTSKKD